MSKRKNQSQVVEEVVNEVESESPAPVETPSEPVSEIEAPAVAPKSRGRKPYAGLTEAKFAKAAKNGEVLAGMEYVTPEVKENKVSRPFYRTISPLAEIDDTGMFHAFTLHTEGWSQRTVRTDLKVMPIGDVLALVTATATE